MEPLRGGNIAGKIPPDVRAIWDEAGQKRTPAEWALRWVWNHPEVSVVLSGMNEEEHIKENIRIANEAYPQSLTDNEVQRVRQVSEKYKRLMKIGCTGCNYCMPCPSGVNIPMCFEIYNTSHIFGRSGMAKIHYLLSLGGGMGDPACASLCQQCGDCEDACPQKLPIREALENVVREFERGWSKPIVWFLSRILVFQRWRELRRLKIKK
jgi:predicted aldo/keto reductase-like oxidoreductase